MKEKRVKNRRPRFFLRSISWSAHVASQGFQAAMVGYMSFYLTDSIFMSAATVAAILAVSRIFDGVSDVIAGFIIDKTNTRWGKARPYTLFTVLMWVAVVMLFSVPDLSNTGKIIYVFLCYNLTDTVGRTMIMSSESVHYKRGFTNDEQIDLTAISGLLGGIASMAAIVVLPILVSNFGGERTGWTIISLALAIPGVILGLLRFFFVPEFDEVEYHQTKKSNKPTIREALNGLFSNRYILVFGAALLLIMVYQGMAMGTYYFKYIVGDIAQLSVVSMAGLLSMVAMVLLPGLTRKLGLRNFTSLFLLIGGIGMLLQYLAPTSVPMLALAMGLASIGSMPIMMMTNLVLVQCMKYTEWKKGKKIEGVIGAVNGVAQKVGKALGAIVVGFLLSVSGYNGQAAVQSASATTMIKFMYIGLPAILMLLAALIMRFYTLEKNMGQIEKELKEREEITQAHE